MGNRKHFMLASFCLLLTAQYLFSQIMLQGTVTDNGGEYLGSGAEPVANALVTVTDQANPSRTFSAHTDEQGQYTIQITQTGVDDDPSATPGQFRLFQNYPNPFNPSTVIGYQLSRPSHVRIEIYNVLGRKIKTLINGFESTGSGHIIWDATDDHHRGVPAGLYIYSLHAGDVRLNRKMLLIDGLNVAASHAMVKDGSNQNGVNKSMSNQYHLRVTGENIETYEQQDLVITENTALDIIVFRTVTDIDGNVYRSVKIGNQWWMAENLKVTRYRNGDAIPNVTNDSEWTVLSTGAYCDYDNNSSNSSTYGRLYNWYAVNDSRNIAPADWHVPTDAEWKELEMCLGMSQSESDDTDFRGTDEGGKLKETGTSHWQSPNTGATNESGFSALPGGYRDTSYGGNFFNLGQRAGFWSSTEFVTYGGSWYRQLYYDNSVVYRNNYFKLAGNSVRLVRIH